MVSVSPDGERGGPSLREWKSFSHWTAKSHVPPVIIAVELCSRSPPLAVRERRYHSGFSGREFSEMKTRPKRATPPLVLVVDDNEDSRDLYRTYLEYVGFRVATARDGREGLDAARRLSPAIIVMDLTMPGLDGWAATRILKSDAALQRIPIVAVSGHAMKSAERAALDAGCDRFVVKPCLPRDFAKIIRDVIREPERRRIRA